MNKLLFVNVFFAAAFLTVLTMIFGVQPAFSQNTKEINSKSAGKQNWSVNPFEQKVFVENKGQFDTKNGVTGTIIRFGVRDAGTDIYFTSSGLTYRHDEYTEFNEEEIVSASRNTSASIPDNDRVMTKTISHFVNMTWVDANPGAQIVASNSVADYYTYPDMNDKTGKSCLKANAFKKIIYKNLYPFIDVEYTFPEGKPGIKYALILHPGADASVIKMHYSQLSNPVEAETISNTGMSVDENGNIQIATPFGNITDHAPSSYSPPQRQGQYTLFDVAGSSIESSFELSGSTVSFNLPLLGGKGAVIDPWTTNPVFSGFNAAYDVDFDLAGNVYVYGGGYPWQEIQFNSAGVKQWTYTASLLYSSGCSTGPCYGDFAVVAATQSSFIVEAFNGGMGARAIKLNRAGMQVGLYQPPNNNLSEMWRLKYNNCTGQAIMAGGGTQATYQACIFDTNVTVMTPVNILSTTAALHDMSLMTMDNNGNCFMATARKYSNDGLFDNVLIKCPSASLLPVSYMLPDNHAFIEVNSIAYVNNAVSDANGFNGMAVDNKYLYTYDGSLLQKWNKNSGALTKSVSISATSFEWGGLDVNDCGDIFVGSNSSVLQLDSNLSTTNTIAVADSIYDIKLGPGNMLYACGAGFVTSVSLTSSTCGNFTLAVSSTPDSCKARGTATATPSGGIGPFTYAWSNGKSTQTATGLSAGTYTVTVNDNGSVPCRSAAGGSQTTTVIVQGGGSFTASAGPDTTVCSGSEVHLNCPTPGSAYQWSPSFGVSDTIIADPTVTPYFTTTYTVTVTSGNCSGTATVTVSTFPNTPTPTLTESHTAPYDTLFCGYDSALSGHQWFFHDTLIVGATGLYYIADKSGNYNVEVIDTNGCRISVGINIVINGLENFSSSGFISIYPNPANDELTISASTLHANEPIVVSITDVLGKIVQQEKMNWSAAMKSGAAINIKTLASGIYFLQLQQSERGRWSGRFVKE